MLANCWEMLINRNIVARVYARIGRRGGYYHHFSKLVRLVYLVVRVRGVFVSRMAGEHLPNRGFGLRRDFCNIKPFLDTLVITRRPKCPQNPQNSPSGSLFCGVFGGVKIGRRFALKIETPSAKILGAEVSITTPKIPHRRRFP